MHRIGRTTSNYRPTYNSNAYSSEISSRLRSKSFDDSYRYKTRYSGNLSRKDTGDIGGSYYGKNIGSTKSYHVDNIDDGRYKSYYDDGGANYGRHKIFHGDNRNEARYNTSTTNDLNGKTKFSGALNESQVDLSNDSLNDGGSTKATYKVVGHITQASSLERKYSKPEELLLPSVKTNELKLKQNDFYNCGIDRAHGDGADRYVKCVKGEYNSGNNDGTYKSLGHGGEDYKFERRGGHLPDARGKLGSRRIDELSRSKSIERISKDINGGYRNPGISKYDDDRHFGDRTNGDDFPKGVRKPIRLGHGRTRTYSRDDIGDRPGNECGIDDGYYDNPTNRETARDRDGKHRLFVEGRSGLPKIRSRSADAIDSRKAARSNKDGLFPVCSRYPNCSVCVIEIPQNQAVSI